MNLFQIGLLFSLPVHTYLLTCATGYWSIFIYVYMTGWCQNTVYWVDDTLWFFWRYTTVIPVKAFFDFDFWKPFVVYNVYKTGKHFTHQRQPVEKMDEKERLR
jgi:hypothetical protein